MRSFLILVVLAAVAAGGWYWYQGRAAPVEVTADAKADNPFGPPTVRPGDAKLPADLQALHDQAEQLWAAAGADAPSSAKAPRMADLYSRVLRGMYNLPGLREREDRLVKERLTPLGDQLFFSKTRYAEDDTGLFGVHVVQPNDSPSAVGRRFGISQEFVNRLRGREPQDGNLRIGETIKVVKLKGQSDAERGRFLIHIDKGGYSSDHFVGGLFARRYQINHGAKESPTPTGTTALTDRVWHPQWTHPTTHQVLPYGDPANILGPIWLPFDAAPLGQAGIGIHGYTGADTSLQRQVSNGCIRMQNDQAEELYNTLAHPTLTPTAVEIVD